MRILYRNMGFGGGAPKSLLEYAKLNKQQNNEVLVAGEYTFFPDYYHADSIETINIPYFTIRKPIKSLKSFIKTVKLVKSYKPDIIHVTNSEQCLFHKLVSIYTKTPTIYMIPGGGGNRDFRLLKKVLKSDRVIVYTEENFGELTKSGFREDQISIIPNRFDFSKIDYDEEIYNSVEKINVLFIGRIVKEKINSVYSAINDFANAVQSNQRLSLKLDIIGNGTRELIDELKTYIAKINVQLKGEHISYHGYQNNVEEWIKTSHICIGKGRSVIDPIMYGRLAFVYNESGNFVFVDGLTIPNLYKDNFTGRRVNQSSSIDLTHVLKNIETLYKDVVKQNYTTINELYNIQSVKSNIRKIYNEVIENHKTNKLKLFHTICGVVKLYFWSLIIRFSSK